MSLFSQSIVPASSDYTVIIPYNSSQGKFDREAYSPAMTGGRASSEEIEQVLKLIEIASSGISTPDQLLKSWCLRFVLPLLLMIFFQVDRSFRQPEFIWCCFLLYVIAGNVWMFLVAPKANIKIKEKIDFVLKLYQDTFQEKGLRWHVPVNFPLYIELFKEYREQQAPHYHQSVTVENHETTTMTHPLLQK